MIQRLATARVRSSHGVRGCVRVVSLSGEVEHLLSMTRVHLCKGGKERVLDVEFSEPLGDDVLLKLSGVDTPEDAKKLSAWEIVIDRSAVGDLGDDEYFVADLVGCGVFVGAEERGRVTGVFETKESVFLDVDVLQNDGAQRSGSRSLFVPFTRRTVGRIDVQTRYVELLAPWLLE